MGKVVEKFKAGCSPLNWMSADRVATMAGRLRRNRIKIMNGDRVSWNFPPMTSQRSYHLPAQINGDLSAPSVRSGSFVTMTRGNVCLYRFFVPLRCP